MASRSRSSSGASDADIQRAVESIRAGERPRACLVCGEDDYLRERAARSLAEALLPEPERTPFNFKVLDGDAESPSEILWSLRTYSLFGGVTVLWVERTRMLVSRLNVDDVLQSARSTWVEATRGGDEANRARAARDVLKVLKVRHLDLDALDPDAESAGKGSDESLGEESDRPWLREVHRYCVERELGAGGESGEVQLIEALEEGWPADNTLVLVAAVSDRRLRLFKALRKHGLVLDVGSGAAAGRAGEEASRSRLARMAEEAGARLSPAARALLEKKVGFDLARLQREVEKLATYAGSGKAIQEAEVEAVVGWTREEGQWDLSNAVQERDLDRALRALRRTLDHGVQPIRLLFQVASKIRDMVHARACIDGPLSDVWRRGMDDRAYRSRVRPRVEALLAEAGDGREGWAGFLRSHPWALFKSLEAAERFRPQELIAGTELLYRTNWALVSGGGPPAALLEQLVIRLLSRPGRA